MLLEDEADEEDDEDLNVQHIICYLSHPLGAPF